MSLNSMARRDASTAPAAARARTADGVRLGGAATWACGGLLSVGDTDAAQGDGEVCGTAIESPMAAALEFTLEKGAHLRFPRFRTHGPVTRHLASQGYDMTTGIGDDPMVAARDAIRVMIDLLSPYAPA